MKFILIMLVVMTALGSSAQYKKAFESLTSSKFGATLIETIQMHLQTSEPIGNLVNMFQNLDQQISTVQEKADASYQRIKASCDNDLNRLNEFINVLQVKSVTLKSEIDTLNPQVKASVATVERKRKEIEDFKLELSNSGDKRKRENVTYKHILDELEQALFGFNQIKSTLNKYIDGLQKGQNKFDSYIQVQKDIKQVKHDIKLEGYKAFAQLFAQLDLEGESEQDALILAKKTTAVVKQFEQYIQSERIREDQAEDSREEAYNAFVEMISGQLIDAQTDFTEMQGILESQSTRLKSNEIEKNEVDAKLRNKSHELEDQTAECLLNDNEYQTSTQGRNHQRDLLDQALQLTTTSLGQLKSDLLKNAGDN